MPHDLPRHAISPERAHIGIDKPATTHEKRKAISEMDLALRKGIRDDLPNCVFLPSQRSLGCLFHHIPDKPWQIGPTRSDGLRVSACLHKDKFQIAFMPGYGAGVRIARVSG